MCVMYSCMMYMSCMYVWCCIQSAPTSQCAMHFGACPCLHLCEGILNIGVWRYAILLFIIKAEDRFTLFIP